MERHFAPVTGEGNAILEPFMGTYMVMPPQFMPVLSPNGVHVRGRYMHNRGAVILYNRFLAAPITITGHEERVSAALVDLREHLRPLELIEVKQNGRKND